MIEQITHKFCTGSINSTKFEQSRPLHMVGKCIIRFCLVFKKKVFLLVSSN